MFYNDLATPLPNKIIECIAINNFKVSQSTRIKDQYEIYNGCRAAKP